MLKLFTHTDLDGVGCALIARAVMGIEVDITFCENSTVDEEVNSFLDSDVADVFDSIIISDLSVSRQVAEKIDNAIKTSKITYRVDLLDHHVTALPLNEFEWCNVSQHIDSATGGIHKTCGTELVFNKLLNGDVFQLPTIQSNLETFVRLVRLWDTWDWKEDELEGETAKKLNDLFHILGRDEFIYEMEEAIVANKKFPEFTDSQNSVLEQRQIDIDRYIASKQSQMLKIPTQWGVAGVVFAEQYISQLGNKLCELNDDIAFSAMIDFTYSSVSLRSIETGADVSVIAKRFGGGGHTHAAGFSFDKEFRNRIAENIVQFGKIW